MSVDTIKVTVNGTLHTIDPASEGVSNTLVEFLRETLHLRGTKTTCNQGGCGACSVVATVPDPSTGGTSTFSINSCLAALYNCDGWQITTIEGLGGSNQGYHVLQETLAGHYGTQCGYCSPGMVMIMHGFTQSHSTWTDEDVEKTFDGHICRCTGYRPILSAFKSVSPADIEDADRLLCSKKNKPGGCCQDDKSSKLGEKCGRKKLAKKKLEVNGTTWYSPTTTQELLRIVASLPPDATYRYMFGNTGRGVFHEQTGSAIISTRNIAKLSTVSITTSSVSAGSAVSITTLMEAFKKAQTQTGFEYLGQLHEHWQMIASGTVRNLGGWAGNIAMKIQHPDFPSDLFSTLVGCGADVLVGNSLGSSSWHSIKSLPGRNFYAAKEVMLRLRFLPMPSGTSFRSYKVMPRSAASLAYVGGSFRIHAPPSKSYTVTGTPILAFNSINSSFVRASRTESFLRDKSLLEESVLQGALAALASELVIETSPVDPEAEYKVGVAQGLLYRAILSIISDSGAVDSRVATAKSALVRPVSKGTQTYDKNSSTWPLGQPIPKIESKAQCAGELKYVDDVSPLPDELFGFVVQSTKANAAITSIDASAALAMKGVVDFITASDIPGVNNMQPFYDGTVVEPVLADGRVSYNGQAVGIVVATSSGAARRAAALVSITYSDEKTPVLTIVEALAKGLPPNQPAPFVEGDVAAGFAKSTLIVEGEMNRDSQYHFHMENESVRVVPIDNGYGGIDVYATSQWPAGTQASIAQVLNMDSGKINVTVTRLGGGFGARIIACNHLMTLAAIAANKTHKPVRMNLDLETNMTLIGWRDPFYFTYKVGVNASGQLQAVQATMVSDCGFAPYDASSPAAAACMPSCYHCPNWLVTPQIVTTDTASNTWCRTPSTIEGITFMEYAMEHVARELHMDPLEFRKLNLIPDGGSRMGSTVPVRLREHMRLRGAYHGKKYEGLRSIKVPRNLIRDMISQIETEADVDARKASILLYNKSNRWRKRGLSVMPMLWPYDVPTVCGFGVLVAIYAQDGTVAISVGGVEMGQGLNTKVAQVAAYTLGCDLDMVTVKPTTVLIGANSSVTGGSVGSDVNSYCTLQAAKALKARLDSAGDAGMTWQQKVRKAYDQGLRLTEFYWNGPGEVNSYSVFGVACTEVEVDLLTGNFQVLRTDIIEDAGTSPSPLVDVGQVEGGWVFGQGLFTTEGPKFDPTSGQKLTLDTWHYKPLMARDIPTDLRVTLLSNAPNPQGVLSSKVTNEPPVCLSFSVAMALRQAISSARADAGNTHWFQMDTPLTVDNIHKLCLVDPKQFGYTAPDNSLSDDWIIL